MVISHLAYYNYYYYDYYYYYRFYCYRVLIDYTAGLMPILALYLVMEGYGVRISLTVC